jgi:hypothetical protein
MTFQTFQDKVSLTRTQLNMQEMGDLGVEREWGRGRNYNYHFVHCVVWEDFTLCFLFSLLSIIIVVLGVHCDIYKSSYNIS